MSNSFVLASFVALWRLFFAQFFTSDSVTSDIHLRERAVWVLAFLLLPGVFIIVLLYPEFTAAVIRARVGRGPASYIDDMLEWVTFVLTTYAMAGTGFVTVLAWDALTFDRRDAAILGPLPLRRVTLIAAKLAALGTLLLAGSIPIDLLNAAVFAFATSDQLGGAVLITHFAAVFAATIAASVFIFAAIVTTRGTVAWLGGPRLTSALGPPLQFLFVLALLCLVILCPAVSPTRFMTNAYTNWLPPAWFMALFEELRGSPRALDIAFQFPALARRASIATVVATAGAVIVSVVEFRRRIDPAASWAVCGERLTSARATRMLARLLAGRTAAARAMADFILLTIARNRVQQGPIAINAAIGAAIVIAAWSRYAGDLASLLHPRTVVLWIPLVLGYSLAVGVRASFFVPSELPASWVFRASAAESAQTCRAAVRASMMALVVPPSLAIAAAVTIPLLGWRAAAWHTLVVCATTTLLVEVMAQTIHHVPFTRPHHPGHAKLKTRWWIYALGLLAFAYWPARLELRTIGHPVVLTAAVASMAVAIAVLEVVGRHRAGKRMLDENAELVDAGSFTVLDLAGVR